MSDIYSTPSSSLTEDSGSGEYGSLERGITGDYEFSIGDTLSEAWSKVSGRKMSFFLAGLLYFVATIAISFVLQLVLGILGFGAVNLAGATPDNTGITALIAGALLAPLIISALVYPMVGGIMMMGIKSAVDAPINPGMIFQQFGKIVPIFLCYLLMTILIIIGYLLFVIPGIYLTIAYALAIPLIVEKDLGPWQALEASRKAITKRWFTVFFLFLLLGIIMVLAMIPLMIGFIWAAPLMAIVIGVMYRNMFGVGAENQ